MDCVLEDIQWSPCGCFFIAKNSKEVRYYHCECNIKDEYIVMTHDLQIVSIGFLGQSDCLFIADFSGQVILWKINRGKIAFKAHDTRLCKVCFIELDNRKLLVTATTLGEISVWNITSALSSLFATEKNSYFQIENANEMKIFSVEINCRCSSVAISEYKD